MERPEIGKVYSEDEIKARLGAELPHWYYEDGWIRRKYKTSGWKATLMVVNTVGTRRSGLAPSRPHRFLRFCHRQADQPRRQGDHRPRLRFGQ